MDLPRARMCSADRLFRVTHSAALIKHSRGKVVPSVSEDTVKCTRPLVPDCVHVGDICAFAFESGCHGSGR